MPRFGPQRRDRPVLATGETKYHGEPVAAVAAETHDAAEEAAALVPVEYEELPALHTIAACPRPGRAPRPGSRPFDPTIRAPAPTSSASTTHGWGDVDAAATQADIVVEGTYAFPMVTQFAIEPHAYMAAPDGDGIAVWSAIQHPYWLQRVIADLLGLPLSKVRVLAPDPGGAFGGKQHAKYEPLLAFMARATGRTVRLVLTLEETFQAVRRGASEVHVRTGFRRDGTHRLPRHRGELPDRRLRRHRRPDRREGQLHLERPVSRAERPHPRPQRALPHRALDRVPWLRQPAADLGGRVEHERGGARRSASTRSTCGCGTSPDPASHSSRTTRRPTATGPQTVERAADMIGWRTPTPPGRGRGIAVGLKSGPTTGLSYSTVRLLVDGSVVVSAGTSDMGQGARTIFAQIAADELGAPLDWVTVVMGDTAVVPYDQQTSASRSSVLMGNAVLAACRDIQAKLRAMAAGLEGVDESAVVIESGEVRIGERATPIREVVARGLGRLGGEIIGLGELRKEAEPDHPLGGTSAFYEFNATAVEVERRHATPATSRSTAT